MSKRKTQEEFEKEFNNIFHGEYQVVGEYVGNKTPIDIKHKCGYIFSRMPYVTLKNKRCICPKCFPHMGTRETIPYVNDIYTTNKEVYNLLYNKEDGHKYREYSCKKVLFVCLNCGEILLRSIDRVSIQGLSCNKCGDGISYAEKFMTSIFDQLNIIYEVQFTAKWAKLYRYDFMFEYNDNKYIVEIYGQFHFNDNKMNGIKKENALKLDKIKEDKAVSNGYTVIRIDANYPHAGKRFEYIKESILNSQLNNIFDMSCIDYVKCNLYGNKSILFEIANDWNNGVRDYDILRNKYHLKTVAITRNLKRAYESKLIKESLDEIRAINRKNAHIKIGLKKRKDGKKVMCNETGEIFDTYTEAKIKYGANICGYFSKPFKYSGRLPDGTPLTWTKIEN